MGKKANKKRENEKKFVFKERKQAEMGEKASIRREKKDE